MPCTLDQEPKNPVAAGALLSGDSAQRGDDGVTPQIRVRHSSAEVCDYTVCEILINPPGFTQALQGKNLVLENIFRGEDLRYQPGAVASTKATPQLDGLPPGIRIGTVPGEQPVRIIGQFSCREILLQSEMPEAVLRLASAQRKQQLAP